MCQLRYWRVDRLICLMNPTSSDDEVNSNCQGVAAAAAHLFDQPHGGGLACCCRPLTSPAHAATQPAGGNTGWLVAKAKGRGNQRVALSPSTPLSPMATPTPATQAAALLPACCRGAACCQRGQSTSYREDEGNGAGQHPIG